MSKEVLAVGILGFLAIFGCHGAHGSLYDPHVFPTKGSFMEGWYTRLIDIDSKQSFGLIFGSVSLNSGRPLKYGSTYIGFIRSNGDTESMQVIHAFPDQSEIDIRGENGLPIVENPDIRSHPHFSWISENHGCFMVTPDNTEFDFIISDIRFQGHLGPPLPWSPEGTGPAGYFDLLPLPLHWYVYSLGSLGNYRWTNLTSNETISGKVVAHQEKNWGNAFPPAWIWVQAFNKTTNVTFVASIGELGFLSMDIPAHLIGYRNYEKNLVLDFLPTNSRVVKEIDGCNGYVAATIWSLGYKMSVELTTKPSTLQRCLPGPTEEGFAPVCVESYVADVAIKIYKLKWWMGYELVEDQYFTGAALEFGGSYLCSTKNPCMGQ